MVFFDFRILCSSHRTRAGKLVDYPSRPKRGLSFRQSFRRSFRKRSQVFKSFKKRMSLNVTTLNQFESESGKESVDNYEKGNGSFGSSPLKPFELREIAYSSWQIFLWQTLKSEGGGRQRKTFANLNYAISLRQSCDMSRLVARVPHFQIGEFEDFGGQVSPRKKEGLGGNSTRTNVQSVFNNLKKIWL